jgi:hypothetical protein
MAGRPLDLTCTLRGSGSRGRMGRRGGPLAGVVLRVRQGDGATEVQEALTEAREASIMVATSAALHGWRWPVLGLLWDAARCSEGKVAAKGSGEGGRLWRRCPSCVRVLVGSGHQRPYNVGFRWSWEATPGSRWWLLCGGGVVAAQEVCFSGGTGWRLMPTSIGDH